MGDASPSKARSRRIMRNPYSAHGIHLMRKQTEINEKVPRRGPELKVLTSSFEADWKMKRMPVTKKRTKI